MPQVKNQGPHFYGRDALDAEIAKYVTAKVGTFVELGAFDGVDQNNTLYFEERGWRGLLIEPIPQSFERCVANRPRAKVVNCACVPYSHDGATVEMTYAGLMSLVKGARGSAAADDEWVTRGEGYQRIKRYDVTVPARPLSEVIDEAGLERIDLLSLDVEGYELDVLSGLDFTRHRPHRIVVEESGTGSIAEFLAALDYDIEAVLAEHRFGRDILYRDTRS